MCVCENNSGYASVKIWKDRLRSSEESLNDGGTKSNLSINNICKATANDYFHTNKFQEPETM